MIAQPLTPAANAVSRAGSSCGGFGWLMSAVEKAAEVTGNWPLAADPAPWQWTCYPRVAIRTPGPDARAVGLARGFAIATAHRWGVAERRGDIAAVVSELLTNALRHALPGPGQTQPRRAIRLGLLQPGPCVLCAVADPSREPPVLQEPRSLAETGRGLHVVHALSDNWGYVALGDLGKVVWAMFSTVTRPTAAGSPEPAADTGRRHRDQHTTWW